MYIIHIANYKCYLGFIESQKSTEDLCNFSRVGVEVFFRFYLDKFDMFASSVFFLSLSVCSWLHNITRAKVTSVPRPNKEHLKYNLFFANKLLALQPCVLTAAQCISLWVRVNFCVFVCVAESLKLRKRKLRGGYRRPTDGKEEQQADWQKKIQEIKESGKFRF